MFTSLSSLISAASPEWEARLLEQTFQQQLYKKNNQMNMWIWLTRFLPQFYKSSPLPTIPTHNTSSSLLTVAVRFGRTKLSSSSTEQTEN